jgi:hypothetical protein
VCNDARWKGPRSSYCSGPKIQPRGGGTGRARPCYDISYGSGTIRVQYGYLAALMGTSKVRALRFVSDVLTHSQMARRLPTMHIVTPLSFLIDHQ